MHLRYKFTDENNLRQDDLFIGVLWVNFGWKLRLGAWKIDLVVSCKLTELCRHESAALRLGYRLAPVGNSFVDGCQQYWC